MDGKGKLSLDLLDVYGDRTNDRADIALKHTVLTHAPRFRDHNTAKRLIVSALDSTQGGVYRVLIFPMRHRPVSRFVRIKEDQTSKESFVLPVDPEKVSEVRFPAYEELSDDLQQVSTDSQIEGYEDRQGKELYEALDGIRKAGLLNLYHKMRRTVFQNERHVFSYVSSLTRIRGDRLFAKVQKDLRDEVKNSTAYDLFHAVSEALHTPPPGFSSADSFKTQDRYGNLQLTFFVKPETLEFIIDADIDDAQGIEHVFQVVSHSLTGQETHPYDIHEILVHHQGIDPGYRLIV